MRVFRSQVANPPRPRRPGLRRAAAALAVLVVSAPVSEAATAHFVLEARQPLPISAPALALLRMGEQTILFYPGTAALLAADGELQPIAGGQDRREFGTAYDAGFGYVLGGLAGTQPSAEVWRVGLDAAQLQWTRLASLPAPCRRPAAAVQNGSLFVAGQATAGAAFFLQISTANGAADRLPAPPGLAAVLSLAPQGDALYLAGRDAGGTLRFWRWKHGAWTAACPPPGELLD